MSNNCPSNNPFDIRNHVQYQSLVDALKNKYQKELEQVESALNARLNLCNQIRDRAVSAANRKVDEQKRLGRIQRKRDLQREKQRYAELEDDLKTQIKRLQREKEIQGNYTSKLSTENQKLREEIKKLRESRSSLGKDPRFKSAALALKKQCQEDIATARAEVEMHWKKKMFTNIESHPGYKNLTEKHRLEMDALRLKYDRKCPDINQAPEYQRLMAKYSECQESRNRCCNKPCKKATCGANKELRQISKTLDDLPKGAKKVDHCANDRDWKKLVKKMKKENKDKKSKRPQEKPAPITPSEAGGILVQDTEAMKNQIARSYFTTFNQ